MSDVPDFVADLTEKRAKAQARVKRAETTLASAKKEFEELDVALKVLTKHGYVPGDEDQPLPEVTGAAEEALNDNYLFLLRYIPYREDWAVAPKYVTGKAHAEGRDDLSADYIRTALWRMAQRDILESSDGRYWRPRKEEAPDAETSEAPEITGPRDGSRGAASHPSPEGSIPSGSTPVHADFDVDLDDDVPF